MSLDLSHTLIHPSRLAAPNRWDFIAFPLILVLFVLLATAAKGTFAPLEAMQAAPISLDPTALPGICRAHGAAHARGDGAPRLCSR